MDYQRNERFRRTGNMWHPSVTPVSVRMNNARPHCDSGSPEQSVPDTRRTSCLLSSQDVPSLAMVYAPCQSWQKLYESAKALSRGTLFAELDKPFVGRCM